MVKFSHESMLRQEEALAELDASIDDWVNKLEQAENRRTRVRQKLLEHVAAAATLSVGGTVAFAEPLQQSMSGTPLSGIEDISTPPRSPSKQAFTPSRSENKSPSPQRSVPSTILEQPLCEEAAQIKEAVPESKVQDRQPSTQSLARVDVESIRIYAGDDVYALLADVENEITKMSSSNTNEAAHNSATDSLLPDPRRVALHRQKSHEMLINGSSDMNIESPKLEPVTFTFRSPRGLTTPPKKDASTDDYMPILANTVYKP